MQSSQFSKTQAQLDKFPIDASLATLLHTASNQSYMVEPQVVELYTDPVMLDSMSSRDDFKQALVNAHTSVRSQNYVATMRSLHPDTLNGIRPISKDARRLFTRISLNTLDHRRSILRNEVARNLQVALDSVPLDHPFILKKINDGATPLLLQLPYLINQLGGASAVSHNFSSGIAWLEWPCSTALLFSSSRIVMTGSNSAEQCEIAANTYIDILRHFVPALPWERLEFLIQNVVCSGSVPFLVDLHKLNKRLPAASNLDLNLFPGLCVHTKQIQGVPPFMKAVILMFRSGHAVITGCTSVQDAVQNFDYFCTHILDECWDSSEGAVRSSASYKLVLEQRQREENDSKNLTTHNHQVLLQGFSQELYTRVVGTQERPDEAS